MSKPIIVAISGPSGAGKTVLSNKLKEEGFAEIISITTRMPRKGEINGVHYNFSTLENFNKLADNNGLIEKVHVNGNFYGVEASEALRVSSEGKPIVVVAEPDGVRQIKEFCELNNWDCITVFVNSPIHVLQERLKNRFDNDLSNLNQNSDTYLKDKEKVESTYQSRLHHVLGKEQEEWVKPAYSKDSIFNLKFNEFNAEVEKSVIEAVNLHVQLIFQNQNKIKNVITIKKMIYLKKCKC